MQTLSRFISLALVIAVIASVGTPTPLGVSRMLAQAREMTELISLQTRDDESASIPAEVRLPRTHPMITSQLKLFKPVAYIVSPEQMLHWLATTDAELTFDGAPINPLSPRSAQNTMVTYCSHRIDSFCGGQCTVYNGGAKCLKAPHTDCLAATHDVGFCSSPGCGGACNSLAACGTRLDNGFCYTPGTVSIAVGSQ